MKSTQNWFSLSLAHEKNLRFGGWAGKIYFVLIHFCYLLSCVQLFVTSWTVAHQASLFFTISWSFVQTHVHWVNDAIQPSHPLSTPSPPALNLSLHQGLFKWISSSHQVANVLELQLQHKSFQWVFRTDFLLNGLISFWLDLLAVQGTLKSLLQHRSSKASILWCSALLMVQLSHLYMTTGKTIALTRQNFIGKGRSLLFNMLCRLL